jgi:PAS domain S-box-containing protein
VFPSFSNLLFVQVLAWWIAFLLGMGALGAAPLPRVLLLFSNDRMLPANVKYEAGIRAVLEPEGGPAQATLYAEFLDAVRAPGEEHMAMMNDYLWFRYRTDPPQAVVVLGPEALRFFLKRRHHLFRGASLLFGGIRQADLASFGDLSDVAGLPMDLDLAPTVSAMLAMRPQTREVLLVSGASDFDRNWDVVARQQCAGLADRVRVISCGGLPLDELTRKVAGLPPESAVLYLTYFRSPAGETMAPASAARKIAAAASVPVFGPYETYLGTGVTGGCVTPFEDEGRALGKAIQRVLAGESTASIGILPPTPPRFIFDAREVSRWKIAGTSLPAGSELRFRKPSLWDQHRGLVITGGSVVLFQTFLIVALLTLRARHLRTENNLRLSDQRFAGIFQGSPAAISIVRQRDGRLVDVNPGWENFFEIPRAEALDRTPAELGIFPTQESEQQYLEFLRTGRSLQSFEQRVRTRSGRHRWRSVSCDLITLADEPCLVALAKDVTEQHEVEDARRALGHAMRLATLGELTASIAHEVNQPLGAILSNTEAAEMLLESEHPPLAELRQILADIRRDDLRASDVVKRVRAMVGKHQLRMVPLDLNDILTNVVRLVSHDTLRRGVTLLPDLTQALPPVCGDRVQLEQVVLNLLLNAMDAMIQTPLADRRVILRSTTGAEGDVEVAVEDAGHGLPPDQIDRVFDSFYTTKETGMGLGLALSRSITETHGGRLTAANNPVRGATFRLILPATQAPF